MRILILGLVLAVSYASGQDTTEVPPADEPVIDGKSITPAIGKKFLLAGETIEIVCTINTPSDGTLKWYHNGNELSTDPDIGLQVTATMGEPKKTDLRLVWTNAQVNQSGTFKCASSGVASEYNRELVVVEMKPIDGRVNMTDGKPVKTDVVLRCQVSGLSDSSYEALKWSFKGQMLTSSDKYNISAADNAIMIKNADKNDVGEYECQLVKVTGTENLTQSVSINMHPFITKFHKSKNFVEDDNARINCEVYGHPVDTVMWMKDEEPVKADGTKIKISEHRGFANATLEFIELTQEDRGNYSCVVSNSLNETARQYTLIRVKDRYAALWPFIGICIEVAVLCAIIFFCERRRARQQENDDDLPAKEPLNANDHKGGARQRNVKT